MRNVSMIRFLLVIFFINLSILSFSQELVMVEPVENIPNQIYASRNPRQDNKGKYCGVLLIHSTINNLQFKGSVVGDVKNNYGIYYVYLTPGTKKIQISDGKGNDLNIKFEGIESKATYQATIARTFEKGTLICKSDPSGAVITLISSDEEINLGKTPIAGNIDVKAGSYKMTIQKDNYKSVNLDKVKIHPNKTTDLGTIKLKK